MILDDLYREVVMDHHRQPRGRGALARVDARASGLNPACGDEITVELQLDGDRVVDVAVHGHGCAISTASGSMLAETLRGRTFDEVRRIGDAFRELLHGAQAPEGPELGDLEALAGVRRFPVRIKCAMLAWTTLDEALGAVAHPQEEPAGAGEGAREGRSDV